MGGMGGEFSLHKSTKYNGHHNRTVPQHYGFATSLKRKSGIVQSQPAGLSTVERDGVSVGNALEMVDVENQLFCEQLKKICHKLRLCVFGFRSRGKETY
jgi:hypothetical protein